MFFKAQFKGKEYRIQILQVTPGLAFCGSSCVTETCTALLWPKLPRLPFSGGREDSAESSEQSTLFLRVVLAHWGLE